MTRCPCCHFLVPVTPCEICASGVTVQRIGPQEIAAQLDVLCHAVPSTPTPKAPRQRPATPQAEKVSPPCTRCGVLLPWSLGRVSALKRGRGVYCEACKVLHAKDVTRAYYVTHYQPQTPREEA